MLSVLLSPWTSSFVTQTVIFVLFLPLYNLYRDISWRWHIRKYSFAICFAPWHAAFIHLTGFQSCKDSIFYCSTCYSRNDPLAHLVFNTKLSAFIYLYHWLRKGHRRTNTNIIIFCRTYDIPPYACVYVILPGSIAYSCFVGVSSPLMSVGIYEVCI